ncbi:MAG: hypothetical protein R2867_04525 [Caldilineaceae bacterium]
MQSAVDPTAFGLAHPAGSAPDGEMRAEQRLVELHQRQQPLHFGPRQQLGQQLAQADRFSGKIGRINDAPEEAL